MRHLLSVSCLLIAWTKAIDPSFISYSSSNSSLEGDDSSEPFSSIQQSPRHQRHLQAIGGCPFEDLLSFSTSCSISAYCKTTSPSTFIECGGDLTNRWAIRLQETRPRCYNNPDNRAAFFFPDSSTVLQDGAYCSRTTLTFAFTGGSVLTSVESSEVFTAPERYSQKTLLSVQTVQACDDSDADWSSFGSQSYCYAQCPKELTLDGESCQVACLVCNDEGRESFSCPNFYPFFGHNCFDAEPPNNFYSEVLAVFDQGDATFSPTSAPVPAPTRKPTPQPTRSPVRAPTRSPSSSPTMPPQTPPTTTPVQVAAPTESPTLPQTITTESPTQQPTLSPIPLIEPPTRPDPPPVKRTEKPVKRTDDPVVQISEAPTGESLFFVDDPIELSPVFFSSGATIRTALLSCTLVPWLLIGLVY